MDKKHPQLIALLGQPVGHSLSPLIHNTAFNAQGLDYFYAAHEVSGELLETVLTGMHALGYQGANVTIPHKEAVRPFLVEESEQARAVGAVNTLVRTDVGWKGENTDVDGFLLPLREFADRVDGARMLVFGAGGAARAVVYALLSTFHPERITLAVRSPERAQPLVNDMQKYGGSGVVEVLPISDASAAIQASTLIVNATPVGMHPDVEQLPWNQFSDFSDHHIVYDLIYRPQVTRLLKQAATRGAICLNGLAMLIGQAAVAYQLWTGHEMPVDLVQQRLSAQLS